MSVYYSVIQCDSLEHHNNSTSSVTKIENAPLPKLLELAFGASLTTNYKYLRQLSNIMKNMKVSDLSVHILALMDRADFLTNHLESNLNIFIQLMKQIITTAKRIGQIDQLMVLKQNIISKMTQKSTKITKEGKGQMESKLGRLKLLLDQIPDSQKMEVEQKPKSILEIVKSYSTQNDQASKIEKEVLNALKMKSKKSQIIEVCQAIQHQPNYRNKSQIFHERKSFNSVQYRFY